MTFGTRGLGMGPYYQHVAGLRGRARRRHLVARIDAVLADHMARTGRIYLPGDPMGALVRVNDTARAAALGNVLSPLRMPMIG